MSDLTPRTAQSDPWHYPAPWSGVAWFPRRPSSVRRAVAVTAQTVSSGLLVVAGAMAAGTLINVVLTAIVSIGAGA